MTSSGSPHANQGSALLRRSSPGVANAYDFRRPTKLSRDHTRALQMSYETFARRLSTQLTTGLRQVCQVNLVAIEQQTYEEYVAGLSQTTILSVLDIDPLPGIGILEFSVPTALACVDYLLGGPGGEQPTRPLTDLETPLLRGLIEQMLGVLRYALEPTGIAPALGAVEYSPQFLQAASASEAFVVGSFEMQVGNQVCLATVCLPLGSIMPRLQTKSDRKPTTAAEQLAAKESASKMREALSGAPIQVTVQFRSLKLTPNELVNLEPGDVVPLNHRVTAPLAVEAGGITFAHALPGRSGSRLAGLIVASPKEKS
ncbi:flagellar motor switch protein FliM [Jatrophihabitans sp. DSM 45814]